MSNLEIIFKGLNGIVSQYFSNQNQSIRNEALNQYNQQLLNTLNNNQRQLNIPIIIMIVVILAATIIIVKRK